MVLCTLRSNQYFQSGCFDCFKHPQPETSQNPVASGLVSLPTISSVALFELQFLQRVPVVPSGNQQKKNMSRNQKQNVVDNYNVHPFFPWFIFPLDQFGMSLDVEFCSTLASFFCSSKAIRLSVIFCWSWPIDWQQNEFGRKNGSCNGGFFGISTSGLPFLLFSQVFEVDSGQGIINRQWPENTTSGNGKNI